MQGTRVDVLRLRYGSKGGYGKVGWLKARAQRLRHDRGRHRRKGKGFTPCSVQLFAVGEISYAGADTLAENADGPCQIYRRIGQTAGDGAGLKHVALLCQTRLAGRILALQGQRRCEPGFLKQLAHIFGMVLHWV